MELAPAMTRAAARDAIAALELPPIVLEIFDEIEPPEILQFTARAPWNAFVRGALLPAGAVPLWEAGNIVTAWLPGDGAFAQFSLEAPDDVWWRYRSFDAVAADLLVDLWEGELDEESLRRVAAAFEFTPIEALLARLEGGDYDRDALPAEFERAAPRDPPN